jgi:hypothetical protein
MPSANIDVETSKENMGKQGRGNMIFGTCYAAAKISVTDGQERIVGRNASCTGRLCKMRFCMLGTELTRSADSIRSKGQSHFWLIGFDDAGRRHTLLC